MASIFKLVGTKTADIANGNVNNSTVKSSFQRAVELDAYKYYRCDFGVKVAVVGDMTSDKYHAFISINGGRLKSNVMTNDVHYWGWPKSFLAASTEPFKLGAVGGTDTTNLYNVTLNGSSKKYQWDNPPNGDSIAGGHLTVFQRLTLYCKKGGANSSDPSVSVPNINVDQYHIDAKKPSPITGSGSYFKKAEAVPVGSTGNYFDATSLSELKSKMKKRHYYYVGEVDSYIKSGKEYISVYIAGLGLFNASPNQKTKNMTPFSAKEVRVSVADITGYRFGKVLRKEKRNQTSAPKYWYSCNRDGSGVAKIYQKPNSKSTTTPAWRHMTNIGSGKVDSSKSYYGLKADDKVDEGAMYRGSKFQVKLPKIGTGK